MALLRCPAAPMCSAELETLPWGGESARRIASTFPVHDRLGPSGPVECPGSGARILVDGSVHRGDALRIQAAGSEWIREKLAAVKGELAQDADTVVQHLLAQDEGADLQRQIRELDEGPLGDQLRRLAAESREKGGAHLGRPAVQPVDQYFPGRPADAPGPGVGERPAGRPAMDLGGGFLGRAAVDNARDQLRTLLAMAIEQMASGQDTLARMTALVESVTALAHVVSENLRAAQGLVEAAVGSGDHLPEPAHRLRAQLAVASESVRVANDGLTEAMKVKVEQVFSQLGTAIEAAKEYRALP